jgi:hypothetical protein
MDQHQPNTGQGHAPQQQETCIWSILALIFAIVFLPFGIIFGIVALVKIKNNPKLKRKRPCNCRHSDLFSVISLSILLDNPWHYCIFW